MLIFFIGFEGFLHKVDLLCNFITENLLVLSERRADQISAMILQAQSAVIEDFSHAADYHQHKCQCNLEKRSSDEANTQNIIADQAKESELQLVQQDISN